MTSSKDEKALLGLLKSKKLEPYLRHIRFPQYKNLVANTRVDFTYPISALVGANGTNKSSILRALFGSPGQNNLGNFWFSTSLTLLPRQEMVRVASSMGNGMKQQNKLLKF